MSEYIHIQRKVASGGGPNAYGTSGVWQQVDPDMTPVVDETGLVSIAPNGIITLPAGTYEIIAYAVGSQIDGFKTRWLNVSDSVDTIIGTTEFARAASSNDMHSIVRGRFTIDASKGFELQIQGEATGNFGTALSFGEDEVYVDIVLLKMGEGADQGDLLHVRDEQTSGTNGGTFTTGAWRTRVLNTVAVNEISGASLAANVVTLPVGTYRVWARAECIKGAGHKLRLRNTSDVTTDLVGVNAFITSVDGSTAVLQGRLVVSGSPKTFKLEHRNQVSGATNGFGAASVFGEVEVYAEILFEKVS